MAEGIYKTNEVVLYSQSQLKKCDGFAYTVAPTGDDPLTPDDAVNVLEELLEAMNQSRFLGLKLNVPDYIVTGIHTQYTDPKDRLYYVVVEALKQVNPRPTWRSIVAALRSPAVNLPGLAIKLEAAHFPNPISTRGIPPESTTPAVPMSRAASNAPPLTIPETSSTHTSAAGASSQLPDKGEIGPSQAAIQSLVTTEQRLESHLPATDLTTLQQVSHQQGQMTIQYVQAKIKQFEKRFNALKKSSRECLEKLKVPVQRVADALTSLPADDEAEHKQFLESHLTVIYQASDHSELFGTMNFHWNYQNYQLLDHLIREFDLEGVKGEMKSYKDDLQQFRKKTPLKIFCQSQKKRRIKPPREFREMVTEFNWPDDVTMETVEEFRQEYAYHYRLHECAMMLAVVLLGSFIVTWFIPASIVEKLKENVPKGILYKYSVTKLEITGECVYTKEVSAANPSSRGGSPTSASATITASTSRGASDQSESESVGQMSSTEQEYHFVEQPSESFFCPVTFDLLLQPHLTACCGKHLSKEAATRIQREGGACPLCKEPHWKTMLNKDFLRQVNELRVFCHHEDRGCRWQGELSDLERHAQSCHMKITSLRTDVLKLPVYSDEGMTSQTGQDRIRHPLLTPVFTSSSTITSLPSPQSITELVRQNPTKRGLAVIITNDYASSSSQKTLSGTKKDGDRMQQAFNTLDITTYWKQNVACEGLRKILREVAQLSPSKTYGSISFVFAGHGTDTSEVYMQDGGKMYIQEIIDSLLPTQAPSIGNIPKLFFFDACRGSNPIKPVMVPKSGQQVERDVLWRSATDLKTVHVPPNGNVLVAYSTITNFRSFEREKEGSVWMKALAEKLTKSKESIEVVLTEVREYLHATYQDPQWKDYMQMPQTVNTLLRKVYLHPSVPSHGHNPALPPAPPGPVLRWDDSHPGHYRGRLLQFEQTKVITDLKEEYRGNYICILTFTHVSTRRSLRFQSERTFRSKSEAKESAAKVAVLFLDVPSQERGNPTNISSGSGGAAVAVDQEKNPISWLKEYCEGKKLPQPQYEDVKCGGQQFKCRVKVEGKSFEGMPCNKKQDAKKAAAQKAVNALKQK